MHDLLNEFARYDGDLTRRPVGFSRAVVPLQARAFNGDNLIHFDELTASLSPEAYPFENAGRQVAGETIQWVAAFFHGSMLASLADGSGSVLCLPESAVTRQTDWAGRSH